MQLQQVRACDVCRLLDFDAAPKLCIYCPLCDAWICQQDLNRWLTRRIPAAIKRRQEPGYRGIPNYEEVAIPKDYKGA